MNMLSTVQFLGTSALGLIVIRRFEIMGFFPLVELEANLFLIN